MNQQFKKELTDLINSHSLERPSNTPDHALAEYLCGCLRNYNDAVALRSADIAMNTSTSKLINNGIRASDAVEDKGWTA